MRTFTDNQRRTVIDVQHEACTVALHTRGRDDVDQQ
jgi:hypothetical protein